MRLKDILALDGVFSRGYRLVRPGGKIKVSHEWYYHRDLLPYVGEDVYCSVDEYWFTSIECRLYPTMTRPPLCIALPKAL
jgi:hypothetical protein